MKTIHTGIIALICIFGVSCGGLNTGGNQTGTPTGNPTGTPTNPVTGTPNGPVSDKAAIAESFLASRSVVALIDGNLPLLAGAIGAARQQSGDPTRRTGTVTITAGPTFAYSSAQPANKLIIVANGATTSDIVVTQASGNFSDPTNFGKLNHQLAYSGTVSGQQQTLTSSRVGNVYTANQKMTAGTNLRIDFTMREQSVDDDTITTTNTVYGGTYSANGVENMTINEQQERRVATIFSNSDFVNSSVTSRTTNTFASSFSANGKNFTQRNALFNRIFRNALATELENWQASGQVVQGNTVVANLNIQTSGNPIRFLAQIGNENIEIEQVVR
jgi:hypothetical protein